MGFYLTIGICGTIPASTRFYGPERRCSGRSRTGGIADSPFRVGRQTGFIAKTL